MGLMKELADLNAIYQKMNVTEVSADTALRASKKADVERGKAASAGDTEKAKAKAAQASRLYKASGEKRKSEPVKQPDRSYPKGKGASYKESYETQKKKEVLGAMKRQGRKLSDKDKNKIANKVVKDKGDTSKSDDRYAYEEISLEIKKIIESGKFSEEEIKNILWNEGYQRYPEQQEKERKTSKQTDPSKAGFTGIGDSIEDIMKQNAAMKAAAKKKTKKEGYQRNPEKGEAEERKAERDRKASGRMPPRGDKRREDFERWYAANVR